MCAVTMCDVLFPSAICRRVGSVAHERNVMDTILFTVLSDHVRGFQENAEEFFRSSLIHIYDMTLLR
jgi:hypothetical protein